MEKCHMSRSLGELQAEKEKLGEQLSAISDALAHPEYIGEYDFEFKPVLSGNDFNHGGLRDMIETCNNRQLEFNPDFVLQAIESELFERFKSTIKEKVNGQATKYLMSLKNELERKMLNDQKESREKKLLEINEELDGFEKMVKEYTPPEAPPKSARKK
jgi:ketol-acid reductoisomerase